MYSFLRRYLAKVPADICMGIWYALLIILVFYSIFEQQAEFLYLAL
jgi:hypothetical protein